MERSESTGSKKRQVTLKRMVHNAGERFEIVIAVEYSDPSKETEFYTPDEFVEQSGNIAEYLITGSAKDALEKARGE